MENKIIQQFNQFSGSSEFKRLLFEESIKPPAISGNGLVPIMTFDNTKIRAKFNRS